MGVGLKLNLGISGKLSTGNQSYPQFLSLYPQFYPKNNNLDKKRHLGIGLDVVFAHDSYASRVGFVPLLVQFLDGLVLKGYP